MSEPKPHELRVYAERQELDDKLIRLHDFITKSPKFCELDKMDQELLRAQASAMSAYSHILGFRIARFSGSAP